MAQKPPAFQFYVKDWLSSELVASMTLADQGVYVRLLCAAWSSSEPGSLPSDPCLAGTLAGLQWRTVKAFWDKYDAAFPTSSENRRTNPKLAKLWKEVKDYHHFTENRAKKAARARWDNNNASSKNQGLLKAHTASASASASALSTKETSTAQGAVGTPSPVEIVEKLANTKTMTPQRETYGRVNVLANEAVRIIGRQLREDGKVDEVSLKEDLKTWCAQSGIEYDADSVARALSIADKRAGV